MLSVAFRFMVWRLSASTVDREAHVVDVRSGTLGEGHELHPRIVMLMMFYGPRLQASFLDCYVCVCVGVPSTACLSITRYAHYC